MVTGLAPSNEPCGTFVGAGSGRQAARFGRVASDQGALGTWSGAGSTVVGPFSACQGTRTAPTAVRPVTFGVSGTQRTEGAEGSPAEVRGPCQQLLLTTFRQV